MEGDGDDGVHNHRGGNDGDGSGGETTTTMMFMLMMMMFFAEILQCSRHTVPLLYEA